MKSGKNHVTFRNYTTIPIVSMIVVQREDGGPWTHGTVVGKQDHNHNNRSYTICITKTGQLTTRNSKHIKVKVLI